MPYKEFGTEPERAREPIRFKLLHEEFEALPEAPAGALNDLVAGIQLDEQGNRVYNAPNLVRFVAAVLAEEEAVPWDEPDPDEPVRPLDVLSVSEARERNLWVDPEWNCEKVAVMPTGHVERFLKLVNSKRYIVRIEVLGELVMWLSEELTGRPLQPSARSARGRR